MAELITYDRAGHYACGKDELTNILVVNFRGPGGVRASAYCCQMNIDIDAEPQAYGPPFDTHLQPMETLANGGWRDTAQNAALKVKWQGLLNRIDELEKKKANLLKPPAPAAAGSGAAGSGAAGSGAGSQAAPPAPPNPKAIEEIDDEIKKIKETLKEKFFWDENPAKRPVNYGKIFWNWYGPQAMTPREAAGKTSTETIRGKTITRHPQLDDKKPYLEDVFGKFPVVQSDYEPGTGYYVSAFPQRVNTNYPDWDQRAFLPPDGFAQVPYGALSTILAGETGLDLNDMVFGVRLDTGKTLTFPFLDRGLTRHVAECSLESFIAMDGEVNWGNINRSNNNWLVLYLAFVRSAGQTADTLLAKFASAANADDFPMMLAFIAQATVDARKARSSKVSTDPVSTYERWKRSQGTKTPAAAPSTLALVSQSLTQAGFSPFAQRMAKKYAPKLGPGLTPPTRPW
jgi:hypothetical protein